MDFGKCCAVVAFLAALYFPSITQQKPARILIKFDKTEDIFELNKAVLEDLLQLQRPIRVIAVVGDARIGKSTTLNVISHIWSEVNDSHVEEIFKTGDTQEAVTRGVWCHIIHPQDKKGGSVLLLDVEDTNLGDDAVTTHLSMFTALVSSGLNVFVREVFQNNNLHFLFHMSRLSDQIFPNITIENFPKLQVVIRGALGDPDGGKTIEDYTKDCIVEPSFQESMKEERKAIAKHFPRNQITVSQIPQVERDLFKDFNKLRKSDYWQEMKRLVEKLKTFPIKKTLGGRPMDGQGLVELAWHLKETMNADSWLDFANAYVVLEKNICKRSREKLIKPLFALPTADEIEARIEDALRNFAMECELETEISAVQKDLQYFAGEKRKAEELELKAKEAENQRIAVEKNNEELKQKFKDQMSEKNIEIERVKREKEEVERNEKILKQQHQEQMETIALLKKKLSKKSSGFFDVIGFIIDRVFKLVVDK